MNRIICFTLLLLCGCQSYRTESTFQDTNLTYDSGEVSTQQNIAPEFLVSPEGIGRAKLGMTLRELKQISDRETEFELIPAFATGLDAIAVSDQGLVQYYILYETDTEETLPQSASNDDSLITMLLTSNYNYQTEEGIKVGTPIQEAEDIYGDAVLAYNTDGESVEYITFNNYETPNIRFTASYFKLISDGLGYAGIYPEYPGATYTTDKYQSDAAIAAIEVSCTEETCSQYLSSE